MQWNSEMEAVWLAQANSELRSEVLALKQEIGRLRALIAEWDAAHGDWVDTPQWDEGDWHRAVVRLSAAEGALIEVARRG